MATLHWLTNRYPTDYVAEARALAIAHGHSLPGGRFKRTGLSYTAVCRKCGLAAWVYPAFPWEEAVKGYATTQHCSSWKG